MSLEQGPRHSAPESQSRAERFVRNWLMSSDIRVNGNRPWDIKVNDKRVYDEVIRHRDIGIGDAYMAGYWDCESIDQLVEIASRARLLNIIPINKDLIFSVLMGKTKQILKPGRSSRALEVGERHYDIGNDLYRKMLGETMAYSCGYWNDAENLDQAQKAKLDLIGEKLDLKSGMSVLDIGGGFGSLAMRLAKNYGVRVVNVGVSKEQIKLADELAAKENLPKVNGLPAVENRFQKYQDLNALEKFDRVVSVGMFEHVTPDYYKSFMQTVNGSLKDDGIFLLHTIGIPIDSKVSQDTWMKKHIFPNGQIPSFAQIPQSTEGVFDIRDWQVFPNSYYDKTLMAWYNNFEKSWDKLKDKYGDPAKPDGKGEFYRMWKFYLLSCAGVFRSGYWQLWQIAMTKHGLPSEYKSVR